MRWTRFVAAVSVLAALALVAVACSGQLTSPVNPTVVSQTTSAAPSAGSGVSKPNCEVFTEGRFTGGGFQILGGAVKVTRGFTIHCDLLLSNNLEVNWNGHQFHMTEHVGTVTCYDDPAFEQRPPDAPVDTIEGFGTGRYDGEDGYWIEFTLKDGGEPGGTDMAALKIYNGDGEVLNVPLQILDGGNIQAHYDQPHK